MREGEWWGGGGLFERGACLMLWPRGERSVGAGGGGTLIRTRALIRAKYGIFFS